MKNGSHRFFKKQEQQSLFYRQTDYINGKPFYIIECDKSFLKSEEMNKLLCAYKGKVFSQTNEIAKEIGEYLFNPRDYYIRALLSSMLRISEFQESFESLCIKCSNLCESEELYEIIKKIKYVSIVSEDTFEIKKIKKNSFILFGTFINVIPKIPPLDFDAFIDLNKITDDCRCEFLFKGKSLTLYTDNSYFEVNEQVNILLSHGIDKKTACAFCNSKNA